MAIVLEQPWRSFGPCPMRQFRWRERTALGIGTQRTKQPRDRSPQGQQPWPLRPNLVVLISTEDGSTWFHFQMTDDKGPFSRKCICPAVCHLSASGSHRDKRHTGLNVLCFRTEPSRMDFSFDSVPENFTDQPVA